MDELKKNKGFWYQISSATFILNFHFWSISSFTFKIRALVFFYHGPWGQGLLFASCRAVIWLKTYLERPSVKDFVWNKWKRSCSYLLFVLWWVICSIYLHTSCKNTSWTYSGLLPAHLQNVVCYSWQCLLCKIHHYSLKNAFSCSSPFVLDWSNLKFRIYSDAIMQRNKK